MTGFGRRAATLTDQVFSSASNVLAVVLVAKALNADDFGRFALGYAVLSVVLSLSRAYFGTQVSLCDSRESARELTAALLGSILLLGPAMVAIVLGVSAGPSGGRSLGTLLLVAVATPIVCLQDIVRSGSVAAGEPGAALVSDAVWLALMALPFALQLDLTSFQALLLWLGASALSLILILILSRQLPAVGEGRKALRRRHPMSESVAFGSLINTVGSLWLLLVVSHALGPAAAGSLRGAASAMGPVNVLISFAGIGLTPALVRRNRHGDRRFCLQTAASMIVLTAGWGVLLLALPTAAGRAAFGASWDGIRTVLPFTVIEYLLSCITITGMLGLKVRHEAGRIRRLRSTSASIFVFVGTPVAVFGGNVRLVAATIALAAGSAAVVSWYQFVRSDAAALAAPEPQTSDGLPSEPGGVDTLDPTGLLGSAP